MLICLAVLSAPIPLTGFPAVEIIGPWKVRVSAGEVKVGDKTVVLKEPVELNVEPATIVQVNDEKHENLPMYNAQAAPWARGARLTGVITSETTSPDSLVPDSVVVKSAPGEATALVRGRDYDIELQWGTFGRLPGGLPEGATVYVDYAFGMHRVDSIVVDREGRLRVLTGEPHIATPKPPRLYQHETAIANIWLPARTEKLGPDNLFPITEPVYVPPKRTKPPAISLLPKTWEKLNSGKPLHILAWGDSVTAGGEASSVEKRWQNRFVAMLQQRFPKANIKLTTAGWGGRNSDSFLNEPPGSEWNFETAVIAPKPDLVVMEFVNDAGFSPEMVEKKYSYLLERFREIGAEWAILTPHLVWPQWMGKQTSKIEEDPRPYVAGVRAFAAKHKVALADASLRYCHLVKEGIPYITLMVNSLNHPDDRGHEMFALSLMELFTTSKDDPR
jgi:lysophospholipase L1-like esterase